MPLTWFGIPAPYCDYGHARAVIIPAPYEGTVSWGKGTANAPAAMLAASPYIEFYDSILGRETFKLGIHGREPLVMPADPWQAALKVKAAVAPELETLRRPVVVGGEHSLSLGAVSACLERWPDLAVLQLDAHADLRDEYGGSRFSHACVMRRIAELGAKFVQAGVRALSIEERQWLDAERRDFISARAIVRGGGWVESVIGALSDHVYLTLDLDCLDPSEMPATGTPEPGGISYHHILDLALALAASGKEVIGMDMVELAPIPGLFHPDYLAAQLLYTLIGAFWGNDLATGR
ncbi:MAG TPA: agmatinase [bacterium]|nr:agmatinase [bacterium]